MACELANASTVYTSSFGQPVSQHGRRTRLSPLRVSRASALLAGFVLRSPEKRENIAPVPRAILTSRLRLFFPGLYE